MSFHYREIPYERQSTMPGITYDVTTGDEVIFCRAYTRHVNLAKLAKVDTSFIAWGGILDETGAWVRGSLDFGDAPDLATREEVVKGICKALGL